MPLRRLRTLISSGPVRLGFGVALGLVCLWLALREIPLASVAASLAQLQWGWVLAAVAVVVGANWLKAVRWYLLFFPNHRRHSLRQLFGILTMAQTLNILVPVARLGELARLYLLGEFAGESKSRTLGTIALEKITDVVMLMVFVASLMWLPFVPAPAWLQSAEGPGFLSAGMIVLAGLVLLWQERRLLEGARRLANRLPGPYKSKLLSSLELALGTLAALRNLRVSAAIWTLSVVIWLLSSLINYLALRALGIELGMTAAMFLLAVLQVGVTVPSSPGKIGVFQYLCVLALSLYAVPREMAVAYGLVLYAIVFMPITLLGAAGLAVTSLKLGPGVRGGAYRAADSQYRPRAVATGDTESTG